MNTTERDLAMKSIPCTSNCLLLELRIIKDLFCWLFVMNINLLCINILVTLISKDKDSEFQNNKN